jgi:hypothetical protein
MSKNRRSAVVSAVTGGLLAAAFLPMAVAVADEYDFTPDLTTFLPSQVEGYPPLINEVTGTESWDISDVTTNTTKDLDIFEGRDTQTTIGSFTNDDYLTSSGLTVLGATANFSAPADTQIDLANFGLGFENEWLDIPSGPDSGISDLLITPFGDFALFGTGFADLATAAG